jgi:two-component system OmpR family sensor kinase
VQGLSGPGITVAVLDVNGTVLTTTQALEGEIASEMESVSAERVREALSTGQPVQWVVTADSGTRQVVVLTAVTQQAASGEKSEPVQLVLSSQSGGITLLVEQVASLAAVDAALGQLRLLLLLGIIGGTVVGVALVLAFTRGVLRPLEGVVDTADAISAGDLHRRLALPRGRNEVARLGRAFDFMVGRLVATLESQRRFVADASHELRTPLTSLKGLAEILVIGAHGNDTRVIEQSAQAINSELERLIRLVTDLLTLSRLDNTVDNAGRGADRGNDRSSTIRPKRAPMDACETVEAAAHQMVGIAATRHVQLSHECAGTLPILGDAGQIKQVLLNLLDNALRYTPEGGQVTVRGAREGGAAIIQVQDTGSGIAPKDLPHIFERFYRGDTSRSRTTGNSGLGMAIVKSIVEGHGGSIDVQSQVGEGTLFTVRLPLA